MRGKYRSYVSCLMAGGYWQDLHGNADKQRQRAMYGLDSPESDAAHDDATPLPSQSLCRCLDAQLSNTSSNRIATAATM